MPGHQTKLSSFDPFRKTVDRWIDFLCTVLSSLLLAFIITRDVYREALSYAMHDPYQVVHIIRLGNSARLIGCPDRGFQRSHVG